jgi:hypothetical protein
MLCDVLLLLILDGWMRMKYKLENIMPLSRFLWLGSLWFAAAVFAQSRVHGADAESIEVRFSLLSLGPTIRDVYFDSSEGRQSVTITNAARTARIRYSGKPQLEFYRLTDDDDGEVIREVIASVQLRAIEDDYMLLFVPASGGQSFRIYPMVESRAIFPDGSWRIVNLSNAPLAIGVRGQEPLVVPARESSTLRLTTESAETKRVEIAVYQQEGWEIVYRSLWSVRPNVRTLVFLIPRSEDSRRIDVRRFNDSVEF